MDVYLLPFITYSEFVFLYLFFVPPVNFEILLYEDMILYDIMMPK